MAIASSSSSSSVPNSYKYDVFLSFRGEDTRKTFTSHLYAALCRRNILAYIDDNLKRREEISTTLLTTIEESKLSIVIFSENYASSRWCLDELVHIMECKEEGEHIVLPVFYGIDPSDVRHQRGSYADAFVKHEDRYTEDMTNKLQEWRNALTAAANLSGFDSRQFKSESNFVEKIVTVVLKILSSISNITEDEFTGLVGMDKHLQKMESLLCVGYPDVRVIGIWGMGGIGKTTLAETVCKRFSSHFECCIFENVSEVKLYRLKEKLFSKLLEDNNIDYRYSSFANDRLRRKNVLVVLDNVTDSKQLECLFGAHHTPIGASQQKKNQFGVGSRIILTSRDKKLLMTRADVIYEVGELDFDEALQLFCWKAFDGDPSPADFIELSRRVVNYAQGNPLALTVLGSHLRFRTTREWESALIELEKAPNKEILQMLRISYDALDEGKKAIFLDIACFLIGEDRDIAEDILGPESHIGINILVEKSLIILKDCTLFIHDLVRQMAWEIVCRGSKELGQNGLLCNIQDVYHVLKKNKGTAATEGIFLDLSTVHGDIDLSSAVFEDMYNLRFLKIHKPYMDNAKSINMPRGLRYLPHSLRYLVWSHYPLKSLRLNFEPQNLVKLDMQHRKLKELWNGDKHLANLKEIDLSNSVELNKLPDLSLAPKLENINLSGCKSLRRLPNVSLNTEYLSLIESGIEVFPSSFESLENLYWLDLDGCERLKSLPKLPANVQILNLFRCKKLESLPSNIWKLKSLETLDLYGCSRLKVLPEISEVCEHLDVLSLHGTGVHELPSSIENLTGLRKLYLSCCENLKFEPKRLHTLTHLSTLDLEGCSKLGCFPSISPDLNLASLSLGYCNITEIADCVGSLSSLGSIDLRGNNFERIPSSIRQLHRLRKLDVSYCKKLRHLPELPSSVLYVEAKQCTSLETVDTAKASKKLPPWTHEVMGFLFYNCWKMEHTSALNSLLLFFISRLYCFATTIYDSLFTEMFTTLETCYPGNEIPKWFNNQWEGCTTRTIKLPQNWLNNNFLGFAICVALQFDDCFVFDRKFLQITTKLSLKTSYGENCYYSSAIFSVYNTDFPCEEIVTIGSDHVFMWYQYDCNIKLNDMNLDAVEASFDLFCNDYYVETGKPLDFINVKRCGIRMIYGQEAEEESSIFEDLSINNSYSEEIMVIPGSHDCSSMEFHRPSNSDSEGYSGCLISHQLLEEPEVITTNQPQTSGTETIHSDAEESRLCSCCLPFLSMIIEWKMSKEN